MIFRIAISVIMVLQAACTSLQVVHPEEDETIYATLAVGDTVEIVTADVEKFGFEITAIEEDALVGEGVHIPFDQVRILSVKRYSSGRTKGGVAVIFYAITLAGLIVGMPPLAIPPPIP